MVVARGRGSGVRGQLGVTSLESRVSPAAALSRDWLTSVSHTPVEEADPSGWYQQALRVGNGVTPGVNVLQLAETNLSARERSDLKAFTDDRYTSAAPSWSIMVKVDQRVVTHAGMLYRVIQVGDTRVPVGGLSTVMTLPESRGHGYARAVLAKAAAFVGVWLWAPFAVVLCPRGETGFYKHLGWRVAANAPVWCDQPGGRVQLTEEVAVYLSCQGDAAWPHGDDKQLAVDADHEVDVALGDVEGVTPGVEIVFRLRERFAVLVCRQVEHRAMLACEEAHPVFGRAHRAAF